MNAKDNLASIKMGDKHREKGNIREESKGKKREIGDHPSNHDGVKKREDKAKQMVKFTPLVMLVGKILMQIKDDYSLKWPKPLHSLPNVRDKKKYCNFHRDHGHYRKDYKDLKE